MKSLTPKKPSKDQRERLILFGLVELYLQTGKPIGSNTLKENGFDALSSATIRNYFTKLEEEGYVLQQHSSGGRIPSALAFKAYAEAHLSFPSSPQRPSRTSKSSCIKRPTRWQLSCTGRRKSSAISLNAPFSSLHPDSTKTLS